MSESRTHWKRLQNPNYIGVYALEDGKDLILTIKSVNKEIVKGEGGSEEERTVIRFVENYKPFVCNSTNSKTIAKIYGTPYIEDWVGKKIQLFASTAKLKGETVEALRIRPIVPQEPKKEKIEKCEECKKVIEAYGSKTASQIAEYTFGKYHKKLCAKCAAKLAETEKVEAEKVEDVETEKADTETA